MTFRDVAINQTFEKVAGAIMFLFGFKRFGNANKTCVRFSKAQYYGMWQVGKALLLL